MEEEQPCRPPDQQQGRGGGASSAKAGVPLQPKDKTLSKQVVILELMEDQSGADVHTAGHEEPHAEAGAHILMKAAAHEEPSQEQGPGRAVTCGRAACTGPDALAVVARGGPMLQKSVSKGLCPVERTTLKQFLKNCVFCGKSWERLCCGGEIGCWIRIKE